MFPSLSVPSKLTEGEGVGADVFWGFFGLRCGSGSGAFCNY